MGLLSFGDAGGSEGSDRGCAASMRATGCARAGGGVVGLAGAGMLRGKVGMAGATTTTAAAGTAIFAGVIAAGPAAGGCRDVAGGEEYFAPDDDDGLRMRVSSSMVFIEARAAESNGFELSSDANCSYDVIGPLLLPPRPLSPSRSKSAPAPPGFI